MAKGMSKSFLKKPTAKKMSAEKVDPKKKPKTPTGEMHPYHPNHQKPDKCDI